MVARFSIKKVKPEELWLAKMPLRVQKAFSALTKEPFLARGLWYLAGGTAFALQIGHRKSFDLDFFTERREFTETSLERTLLKTNKWATSFREEGTLFGTFLEAKVSFIAYPFFRPSSQRIQVGRLSMLAPRDIAVMKIIAISQRGRKRDFVDLYWYCKNQEPLIEIIKRTLKQYAGQEHNLPHILKSLAFFQDADVDPMPPLSFRASWREIKGYFEKEVARLTREFFPYEHRSF